MLLNFKIGLVRLYKKWVRNRCGRESGRKYLSCLRRQLRQDCGKKISGQEIPESLRQPGTKRPTQKRGTRTAMPARNQGSNQFPVRHQLFVACVITETGADDEDQNGNPAHEFRKRNFFMGAPFRKRRGHQTRSYSTTPSIMVRSTLRLVISMGSILRISSERTIRSASLPTSTLPLRSS